MSNEEQKDEWETAEENLKALSIKEPAQAPNLLLKHPGHMHSTGGYNTSPSPSNGSVPDGEVDPVVMGAIQNSRERMNVFHIEDNILRFMKSNDRTMELPQCNSFRRLLYYRVGQRFGLCHTQTDQLMQNGERTVVLYKTASSFFPAVLLIDLAASTPVDTPSDGGSERGGAHSSGSGGHNGGGYGSSGGYNNNSNSGYNNNSGYHQYDEGNASPYYQQQQQFNNNYNQYANPHANPNYPNHPNNSTSNNVRKVQVMKRKPVLHTTSTKATTSRTQQTAEDKERAYIEARARIFGESGTPEPEGAGSSGVGGVSGGVSTSNSPFTLEDAAQLGDSECSTPGGSAEGSVGAGASASVGGVGSGSSGSSSNANNNNTSTEEGGEGNSSVGTTTGAVDGDSVGGTLSTNSAVSGVNHSSASSIHSSAMSSAHSSGQVSKVPSTNSLAVLEGSGTSSSTLNTAGIASGSNKSNAGNGAGASGIVKSVSNNSLSSTGRTTTTPTNNPTTSNSNSNYNNNNNAPNPNYNNSNTNNNRRAVVRNIDAERSDPDFVRRNVRNTPTHPNNTSYNNNTSSGGYNNNNYNNNQYNRSPRYNNTTHNSNTTNPQYANNTMHAVNTMNTMNTATMQYIDPQQAQAMYMQQMQMYNMQNTLPTHTAHPNQTMHAAQPVSAEQMQVQMQLQMQYQQMQLQMQMQLQAQAQAQAQQQQVQYGGVSGSSGGVSVNPYYPNTIQQIPVPQGYVMVPGQVAAGAMPPPMMDYYTPHPGHATHPAHPMHAAAAAATGGSGYDPAYHPQQARGGAANTNNTNTTSSGGRSKQYKQEYPALG